jgi:predicted nuclease of predicted toxin-antitoxin system
MKFLIDRCAGHRLAEWLRGLGHEVAETKDRGPDPGDAAILMQASAEGRILVTIDTDFGELIFARGARHSGLVRLPDVPANRRIQLMDEVLRDHTRDLEQGRVITVRGGRIRISDNSS